LVVFACAAAAGAHAGLVPEHLREESRLGVAFVLAALLLSATGTATAIRPGDRRFAKAAALALGGLIAAYAVSRTTGIPLLAPDREAVDAVGVVTTVVEALGVACALRLGQSFGRRPRRPFFQEVSR
jgi:putative Mn2+ efflux pump MntP